MSVPQPVGYPGDAVVEKMIYNAEGNSQKQEELLKRIEVWDEERKRLHPHGIQYKLGGAGQHGKNSWKLPQSALVAKNYLVAKAKSIAKARITAVRRERELKQLMETKRRKKEQDFEAKSEVGSAIHKKKIFWLLFGTRI